MDLRKLVVARRDEILALAGRHGATNVRIFGSVARGEAKPGSDIDFLVDFEAGRNPLDHVGLKQDLEELLGVRVDVLTEGGLHPQLRESVFGEAVKV